MLAFHAAAPDNLLGNAILQEALKAQATLDALQNGDVAIMGTVHFLGKDIALFAIDNASQKAQSMFGT